MLRGSNSRVESTMTSRRCFPFKLIFQFRTSQAFGGVLLLTIFAFCVVDDVSPRCAEELLLGVYDEYEDYCSEKGLDRG